MATSSPAEEQFDTGISTSELPNPTKLAPMIARSWAHNLVQIARYQWKETATIEADDFVQLTHITSNHLGQDGKLQRTIASNDLHYQRKAGMKKRIRKNLELNGSAWIERLSQHIAAYAYPNESKMEDWVSRSSMIVSTKKPYAGSWEIKTRRALGEENRLLQWVEPRSQRTLARNFDAVFEGEKVHGELIFQNLGEVTVLHSAKLNFPGLGYVVRFAFENYAMP